MQGIVTISTTVYRRDSALRPWRVAHHEVAYVKDVYEGMVEGGGIIYNVRDEHGNALVMTESHTDFAPYAVEE
jgi:hypothetical protein